jgi:SWI/SNF-related matrix-associated actin-dependent regulator of chromatin subfamily A member 5
VCKQRPPFLTLELGTASTGQRQEVNTAECVRVALVWNEVHNTWLPAGGVVARDAAGAEHTPLTAPLATVPEPATTSREASDERKAGEDDEDDEEGDDADGDDASDEDEPRPRRPAPGRHLSSPSRLRTRGGQAKPGGVDATETLFTETGRPRRAAAAAVFYGSPAAPAREPRGERPRRTTRAAAGGGQGSGRATRGGGGGDDAWVRRSERSRSSRLVTVRGVPVLRSNLRASDVVDDGVAGVTADWMEEEEDEPGEDDGDHEEGDSDEEADGESDEENLLEERVRGPRAGAKRRRGSESPAAAAPGGASKKRAVSGPEARRLAHNKEMDGVITELAPVQESYLAQHIGLLRPWLEAKVLSRLEKADKALCPPVSEYTVPAQVTAMLRAHQVAGFQYLVNAFERGLHPILGDEMGLGKTLQTVTLLAHATFGGENRCGPHLVVCPLSVLQTWQTELYRWCPALRVVRCHSSDVSERARLRDGPLRDPGAFDVALTTYEMLTSDMGDSLRRCLHWGCLVLDEGHRLKNEASQAAGAVAHLHRRCTVLLTGTLLQNNMHELWALLHVCYPRIFTDSAPFDAAFDLKQKRQVIDAAALTQARAMLRPLWLRREKADVELNLPPKTETLVHCPLSAAQTALYRSALLSNAAILDASVPGVAGAAGAPEEAGKGPSTADVRKMNHLCMQLRLLCGHPLLCTDEKDFGLLGLDEEDAAVETLIAASGKLSVLDRLLQRLLAAGHRVVIFTQFSMVLDILEEYCTKRSLPFARLDGSVCRARRQIDIMLFNRKDSPLKVFLASTRAGGLGINLQSADTCILYDSDWNPQADAQAMARVHRIGQTKQVAVFRLVTANTVEERIVTRANKKLYMDAIVARTSVPGGKDDEDEDDERALEDDEGEGAGGDSDSEAHQAGAPRDRRTLAQDLRFGADALFKSAQGKEPSDEELDALCDRSEAGEARRAALACLQQTGTVSAEALTEAPLPLTSYLGPEGAEMRRSALEAARRVQEEAKRSVGERVRTTVTVQIDGFAVKRSNMYGLEEGEPSVWDVEAAAKGGGSGRPAALPKRKVLVAGRDYGHSAYCQVCWEGGDLFCCNYCPAVYHAKCVGISAKQLERAHAWSCPHHQCSECDRKSAACGGLLFRCESCATAYCEDHLPEEVMEHGRIVDLCDRWVRLGMTHQPGACFIHCSQDCEEFAASGFDGALEDNGEEVLPPWVQQGDPDVVVPFVAGAPGGMPLRGISFSALKRYIHSVYPPTQPLPGAPEDLAEVELRDYSNDDEMYGAMYMAARAAIARDAPNRAAPAPKPSAAGAAGQGGGDGAGAQKPARRPVIRWTPPEEALLHSLTTKHAADGHGKWANIFTAGAGTWHQQRTAQDLQVKWYQICAKKRREAAEAQPGGPAGEGAEAAPHEAEDEMDEDPAPPPAAAV